MTERGRTGLLDQGKPGDERDHGEYGVANESEVGGEVG